ACLPTRLSSPRPPCFTSLLPYTTLFRSVQLSTGTCALDFASVQRRDLFLGQYRRSRGRPTLAVPGVGATGGTFVHRLEDLQHLTLAQGLLLQQLHDQFVEDISVLDKDLVGLVVGGLDEATHLLVDDGGDLLGVLTRMRHLPTQERLTVGGAKLTGPQTLTHAVLGDHVARQGGGLVDVVARTRGGFVEDQLLGGSSAQHHGELIHHL